MKKQILLVLVFTLVLVLFGCTDEENTNEDPKPSDQVSAEELFSDIQDVEIALGDAFDWTELLANYEDLNEYNLIIEESIAYQVPGSYEVLLTIEIDGEVYEKTFILDIVDQRVGIDEADYYESIHRLKESNPSMYEPTLIESFMPGYYNLLDPGINASYLTNHQAMYVTVDDYKRVIVYDTINQEGRVLDMEVGRESTVYYFDDESFILNNYSDLIKYNANGVIEKSIDFSGFLHYDAIEQAFLATPFLGGDNIIRYFDGDLNLIKETSGGASALASMKEDAYTIIVSELGDDGLYDVFSILEGKRVYILQDLEHPISWAVTKDFMSGCYYYTNEEETFLYLYDGQEVTKTLHLDYGDVTLNYMDSASDAFSTYFRDSEGNYVYHMYSGDGNLFYTDSFEHRILPTEDGYFVQGETETIAYSLDNEERYRMDSSSVNIHWNNANHLFGNAYSLERYGRDVYIVTEEQELISIRNIVYQPTGEDFVYLTMYDEQEELGVYRYDHSGFTKIDNPDYQHFVQLSDPTSTLEFGDEPNIRYLSETSYVIFFYQKAMDGTYDRKVFYHSIDDALIFEGYSIGAYYSLIPSISLVNEEGDYLKIPIYKDE